MASRLKACSRWAERAPWCLTAGEARPRCVALVLLSVLPRARARPHRCGSRREGVLAWWLRLASVHAHSTSLVNSWGRCYCILQTRTLRPRNSKTPPEVTAAEGQLHSTSCPAGPTLRGSAGGELGAGVPGAQRGGDSLRLQRSWRPGRISASLGHAESLGSRAWRSKRLLRL